MEILVKMKLVNPNPTGPLEEHLDFLKIKINELNAAKSSYNQKKICISGYDQEEDAIILKVETERPLNTPGRAFTGLSRSLLDEKTIGYDDYFAKNVFHGRLLEFRTVLQSAEEKDKLLSDTELLVRTVLLATKPKSLLTNREKEILQKMKMLAAEIKQSQQNEERGEKHG